MPTSACLFYRVLGSVLIMRVAFRRIVAFPTLHIDVFRCSLIGVGRYLVDRDARSVYKRPNTPCENPAHDQAVLEAPGLPPGLPIPPGRPCRRERRLFHRKQLNPNVKSN